MEILVLGDSLAFGRPKYGVGRHQTWPYLLSKDLDCGLQMRAKGGATMGDVVKEAGFLNSYWFAGVKARQFDVAFVQAGIVDCCPRLLPRCLYGYAKRVPGFRKLDRSPLLHALLARPWTSEKRFSKELSELKKTLSIISKVSFFVEIARPANFLVENIGDFSGIVARYNKIIRNSVGQGFLVDWQGQGSGVQYLLPDGHHLSSLGHQAVAKACLNNYQGVL